MMGIQMQYFNSLRKVLCDMLINKSVSLFIINERFA